MLVRLSLRRFKRLNIKPSKKGRVNHVKAIIDGHKFASKSEAKIYHEYKIDPDIEILELQPKFVLQKSFKRKKKTIRAITYKPDFQIKIKGVMWIVEVKSMGTLKANSKSYPMRRKLFLNAYPDLNFREIIFDGNKRKEINYEC